MIVRNYMFWDGMMISYLLPDTHHQDSEKTAINAATQTA